MLPLAHGVRYLDSFEYGPLSAVQVAGQEVLGALHSWSTDKVSML